MKNQALKNDKRLYIKAILLMCISLNKDIKKLEKQLLYKAKNTYYDFSNSEQICEKIIDFVCRIQDLKFLKSKFSACNRLLVLLYNSAFTCLKTYNRSLYNEIKENVINGGFAMRYYRELDDMYNFFESIFFDSEFTLNVFLSIYQNEPLFKIALNKAVKHKGSLLYEK